EGSRSRISVSSSSPMRSLLALTLVVSAALAAGAPRHTLTPNYYEHLPAETPEVPHTRAKRSGGFRSQCPNDWTGDFCQNPVCHNQQQVDPYETDLDKTVDIIYAPEGCDGEYYVPVDSTTNLLTVTVTTDEMVKATAILTAPDGSTPLPISSEYAGRTATYRFKANPDKYVLSFTVDSSTEQCIIHIQAQSKLTFDGGWVSSPNIDNSPFGESLYNSKAQYFILHPFELASPGEVKTVTVRQAHFTDPEYRAVLTRRFDCAFEFYAGMFQCKGEDSRYLYTIEGTDAKGKAFRRTRPFMCLHDNTPTVVPPPTTPSPTTCLNGGSLLYSNETDSSFCFCTELMTGSQCEEVLCMNGGIRVDDDKHKDECDCMPGFVGKNCDNVVCDPEVGKLLTDTKTLAVVIRNSASMAQHIYKISAAIDEEVTHHAIDGRPVYDGYILSYVRDGVVTAKSYDTSKLANFLGDMEKLATKFGSDTACTDSLVGALEAVYEERIMDQSPIFLFTDAAPEPSDTDQFKDIMRLNSANRMQLHTFFMATQENCKANPNLKFYNDLARYTAGLVHKPPTDSLEKTFQNSMRATTYKMNLVESADLKQCKVTSKAMIVDFNSDNLILIATGVGLTMTVTDPNWEQSMKEPFWDDGYTHFFNIPNPKGGEWLYSVDSDDTSAPCSYRFYSQSDFDLFLGTTSSVNIDERTFEPVVGQAAHLVAQVNGFYGGYVQDQFRLFAEILITSPDEDDKHQPLYYSNGMFRSSCGFHLYFGVANFCREEDQIFYATVFVDDENGFPIQRAAVGYCNPPTDEPHQPDECLNGGVRFNETTCWCPSHYSGDLCQTPQCLKGGRLNQDSTQCICPGGVTGNFCELMECTTKADDWEANFDHRTLNFVVSTRHTMKDTVKKLADGAATFAGYYQRNHKNWIDHFAIVTVNATGADMHLTNSPQEFADMFRQISDNFDSYTDYDDDNCTVALNRGISSAVMASFENSNVFVFSDGQADLLDFPGQLNLLDRADELHVTVTLFGTDYGMCDGSGSFGDQESNVVSFTGGKIFYTDKIDRVFDYIDTFYYSGVIVEKTFDNCDAGVSIDFPLEASAHSVVVTVQGQDEATATVAMSTPDELDGLYHDPLMDGKKFSIIQYIQACPNGWDTADNMCYMYDVNEVQWIASFVACGNADSKTGSSLVSIFTDDKHDQVQEELKTAAEGAWIGLYRQDDMVWKWMQAGVDPVPMDPAMNKYFAPGQNMDDNQLRYVYMKGDGLWYLASQADRHWTICQKERYGGSYNPEDDEPDLPPGFWNLKVTSASKTCTVNVRTQSDVQVAFGFSQNPHDDFKRGTANVDSKTNYVVAKASGLDGFEYNPDIPEGKVDYATISADGKDVYPLAMNPRAESCTFNAISTIPFACPSQQPLSEIVVKFEGIDQFGYSFERSLVSRCDTYAVRCNNGGFAHNGECVCPPHYDGDDCSKVICENGGTPVYDGTCKCPALFTGKFCNLAKCDPAYPDSFERNKRTLVIALETSFTMATPIFYLAEKTPLVDAIGKVLQKRPDWFDTFVIIPFDSTSNKDKWFEPLITYNYLDIDAFMDKIPTAQCPGDNYDVDPPISCPDTNCPRPIGGVIMDALDADYMTNPDSTVVVITNSGMEDHNLIYDIVPRLVNSKAQLHFVITPSASPCSLGWDDEMNKAMQYFASFSVGTVTSVVPKNLASYFSDFLPSMYKAQEVVIDSQYVKDCSAKENVFQIDHEASEFNMQFFGVEAEEIVMTGPLGNVTIPPNILPGSSAYFGVFEVDNNLIVPGTYIVRTKSAGTNCDLKVRASTDILVDVGFTQVHDTIGGNSQDDAHYAGLYGVPNKVMFHVGGLDAGAILYAQVVSPRGDVIATNRVLPRESACTYTFVMDGTFDCDYTDLEIVAYGVDNDNMPFHRNFRAHCTDDRPQPIPPNPTCDLGAMKADIAFLVDTSVDASTVNWFQLFITQMMTPKLTIGTDNARFAVMSLSDAPEKGGFFNFVAGSEKSQLVPLVYTIHSDGNFGQNITSAIPALMKDIFTKDNGYRGDDKSVKKLLVYLTASNPTDVDPVNAILDLQENKITGVAVASFRISNPSKKLKSLVDPHCFWDSGPDGTGFNVYGPRFMQNLLCANQPICGIPPPQ
ncbi:hypothetical protein PMAYCL1PPCAC_31779, partial [Pristionchus mayeri]